MLNIIICVIFTAIYAVKCSDPSIIQIAQTYNQFKNNYIQILMNKKRVAIISFSLITVIFFVILHTNSTIIEETKKQLFSTPDSIPANNTGLLLGTSKLLKNGKPNQYFTNRISATIILYRAHKIKNIVISGDNSISEYNEPEDMKKELIKKGIPENHIYLDFAGFRTYDSVYRMKEIFGQSRFTIISQEFHNQRALFIANKLNLKAIGFNAKEVDAYSGFKTKIREKFARVKVFIDLYFDIKPKFLGNKIVIK